MYIVAGLGNPGIEYHETRHNVGFMAVDLLADRWGVPGWRTRFDALLAECRWKDEQILLVKPQTYMNLSGNAVGALARWYKVPVEQIIVIYDDMDIPTGKIRLRDKGGSGGHRGMESLLAHLPGENFLRVRLGIGRPPQGWAVTDYVLSRFRKEEEELLVQALERSGDAVESLIQHGIIKTMNKFHSDR